MTARKLRLLLERARARIERGWCQRASACDRCGRPAAIMEPRAVAWDVSSALQRECGAGASELVAALDLLRMFVGFCDFALITWNDAHERTQADVLALYDAAISAARSDEAMERA